MSERATGGKMSESSDLGPELLGIIRDLLRVDPIVEEIYAGLTEEGYIQDLPKTEIEAEEASDSGPSEAEGALEPLTNGVEEGTDNYVVEAGEKKVYRYTREELLKYRNSPLSMNRPDMGRDSACWRKLEEDIKVQILKRHPSRERPKVDNVVLSPQSGANFKQGCSMAAQQGPPQQRRIGSGRLFQKEWEAGDGRAETNDLFNAKPRRKVNSTSSDDFGLKGERPSRAGVYRSDGDGPSGKMRSHNKPTTGRNFHHGNQPGHRREEGNRSFEAQQPQWFTEGPKSRHDRIDLHGFDGPEPDEEPKKPEETEKLSTSTPKSAKAETKDGEPAKQFDFDDYMNMDVLSPLLTDLESASDKGEEQCQSRFLQYFRAKDKLAPESNEDEVNTMERKVPAEGDGVEKSGKEEDPGNPAIAFISAFCKDQPTHYSNFPDLAQPLMIPTVDELEARVISSSSVKGIHREAIPIFERRTPPPINISSDVLEPDVETPWGQFQSQMFMNQMHQLQQQQMFVPPTSMAALPILSPELLYLISQVTLTREITSRIDYQSIMTGVKQGVITPQSIVNLVMNRVMNKNQLDVLLAVLNVIWTSQRAGSPVYGRDAVGGPLPHAMGVPVAPTQNDLAAHAANVMQSALIKRKLEEQKENFRKRQENTEQPRNPSPGYTVDPSILAFTPPSVLRKMTTAPTNNPPNFPQDMSVPPPPIPSPLPESNWPTASGYPKPEGFMGPLSPTHAAGMTLFNDDPHVMHDHFLPPVARGFIQPWTYPWPPTVMPNQPWMPEVPLEREFSMMTVEEIERAHQRVYEAGSDPVRRQ